MRSPSRQRQNTGAFVGAIIHAIIVPEVAVFGCLVIAVVGVFRARGGETPSSAPEAKVAN